MTNRHLLSRQGSASVRLARSVLTPRFVLAFPKLIWHFCANQGSPHAPRLRTTKCPPVAEVIMKWQVMVLLLWASAGVAQQNLPAPRLADHREAASVFGFSYQTSYKDVNCAGFISRERLAVGRTIQGGTHSPEVDHFTANDTVFLAGSGYEVGGLYSVLRELRDPNRYEYIAGQNKRLAHLGHLYAELGHLKIDHLENGYAVAKIEVSCQPIAVGDVVVPFQDKGTFSAQPRTIPFQVFGVALPRRHGTIVMASDFDYIFGLHKIVYVDLGSRAGLKPGDYLRISRSYDPDKMPEGNRSRWMDPITTRRNGIR